MIFIDSWVWIELFLTEDQWKQAEQVIDRLKQEEGIISSLVLAEVRYRMLQKTSKENTDRVIQSMESIDRLQILPVTARVATYGADLRNKYYQRGSLELSYADAIHLATAVLSNCQTLYSGDPDFESIEEIETDIIGAC